MRISEVFYSVQGEGVHVGVPTAFVRFQGCPYRCRWCDSQYTWEFGGGDERSLEDVLATIERWPTRRVCVTGGEPLAQMNDFRALAGALKEREYWVEVETSGGYQLPWDMPVDSWVVDVKCPASGMRHINRYDEIPRLRPADQLKFVVSDRGDFDFALGVLKKWQARCQVLFSPVWGETDLLALAEWVKSDLPTSRLSVQVHKVIWGPDRRAV